MKLEINSGLWKTNNEWFAEWFDTHAYHVLYGNRDDKEAGDLVKRLHEKYGDNLINILDAGCGAGRHVIAWSRLGYNVKGFDLSSESIEIAKTKSKKLNLGAEYKILDMRSLSEEKEWTGAFDLVTNLFTSFGYFNKKIDHENVVKGFCSVLKPKGILVLDYLNFNYSKSNMISEEIINKGDYTFNIKRRLHKNYFQKSISYIDQKGKKQTHIEQVKAWNSVELSALLLNFGFQVESIYGDYELGKHTHNSPRCILVARKMKES
jgi:2-polyprenyl-3-methyl-5-hydroxy-6-metoxy-1,4-benzoquinol methylase